MKWAFCGPQTNPAMNAVVGDFVSSVIWGEPGRFEKFCTMAVMDGPSLIGGVVYHNWHPDAGVIELSAGSISRRWLSRPILKAMFGFVFDGLGCQLAVLRVSERNTAMIRIARAYGFSEHVIPRMRGRDEAEHIFTLADDDWRQSRFHKERT